MADDNSPPVVSPPPGTLEPLTDEDRAALAELQRRLAAENAAMVRLQIEDRLAAYRSFVDSPAFTDFEQAFDGLDLSMVPTEVSNHVSCLRTGLRGLKNTLARFA